MRKLAFFALLFCVYVALPQSAHAQIANTGKTCVSTSGASSVASRACTWSTNPSAGSLIACVVANDNATATFTVVDGASNTYTSSTSKTAGTWANVHQQSFYAQVASWSGTTSTVNSVGSNSDFLNINCKNYTGVATSSPVDGTPTGRSVNSDPSTGVITGTAVVTTQNGDLIFVGINNQSGTITAGTGFGHLTTGGGASSDQVQVSAGSITATGNDSITSDPAIIDTTAFKQAPSGPGGTAIAGKTIIGGAAKVK